ncbi:hypothetical protein I79_019577 [Cricetulus griseus]|uniref:Uncharacterized protein n=1 Tax=Cricetulus griseus TaxID=10029 RepID=G3I7S9_CRIGR|nr:hypothetical protein I79_019577 [Cricetulus griseus]
MYTEVINIYIVSNFHKHKKHDLLDVINELCKWRIPQCNIVQSNVTTVTQMDINSITR